MVHVWRSPRWHAEASCNHHYYRNCLIGYSRQGHEPRWDAEAYFIAQQALYFDIRKGAHSIGSNVRDAAAYVLWALARAQDASSLSSHAVKLAQSLVCVSLFDRDVSIRRAASAAFQEHVGRMVRHRYVFYSSGTLTIPLRVQGLFARGIDVLRKTDFYSVSIRRNAFLTAAPQVAE